MLCLVPVEPVQGAVMAIGVVVAPLHTQASTKQLPSSFERKQHSWMDALTRFLAAASLTSLA